jgi:hypothetical protein
MNRVTVELEIQLTVRDLHLALRFLHAPRGLLIVRHGWLALPGTYPALAR